MPSQVTVGVSGPGSSPREASSHDELIARAAHELRGPLGSIANWVHLLSQSTQDGALQQQGLAAIQRALQLSGRLLDELSDVALLRSGKVRLRSGLLDLVPILEMALEKPRAAAREKAIDLALTLEVASVPVMGDPDRLQQIVHHLVGNAVKFTPGGGRVDVGLARDGASWRLSVSDSGPGLTPEVLPRVFDGLRSTDYLAPRTPASLGVGLSIVRHLAELHGGSAEATSPGPGGGACFTVRLPVPALVPARLGSASEARPDPAPASEARASGRRQSSKPPAGALPRP